MRVNPAKSHIAAFSIRTNASILAMAIAMGSAPALAEDSGIDSSQDAVQADQPAAASGSTIVVTGSRIVRNGADMPTPVAVVSSEELVSTSASVIEGLNTLPQLQSSVSASANGNFGVVGYLNLRALGASRTLVLLNGRRLTPATTAGSPDVNTLPSNLVQRVDIVTGGASAAYGSDAVAGVVNFVLDNTFTGLKANGQVGVSNYGDNETYVVSLTGGQSFLDDRLHVVGTAEWYRNMGVLSLKDRDWGRTNTVPIPNPNVTAGNPASPSNPNLLMLPDARVAHQQVGGLITSGPLAGTQFLAGGVPAPFAYGDYRSGQWMIGGDGPTIADENLISFPTERRTAFVRAQFEASDALTFFVEGMFADNETTGYNIPGSQAFEIYSGNAFLPASIQQQMTDLGLDSFSMGRLDLDWGLSITVDKIKSEDFTGGVDGNFTAFGNDFTWNAYYQHGRVHYTRLVPNDPINVNVWNSVDAVEVTADNVGDSGLPLGSIVCRTTLTLPTNGCVPYNPFGPKPLTAEEEAWMTDEAMLDQVTKQDSAAVSVQGTAFQNWAGDVSIALGAEWRQVKTVVTSSVYDQTIVQDYIDATAPGLRGLPSQLNTPAPGIYQFGNYQPVSGSYNVKEFFAETVVPLATDMSFAQNLELNAAVRYTDYSVSGGVWTWKAGLVYEPFDGLRVRFTRSRDIRAPNINDLFSAGRLSPQTVRDPVRQETVGPVNTYTAPNLNLQPEKADTMTLGFVVQPAALPGFTAQVDAYDIKINGAIAAPSPQQVLDECFAGNTEYCSFITRQDGAPDGALLQVLNPNVNLQALRTRGIDFEVGYTTDLGAGRLALRAFANYTDELSFKGIGGAPTVDLAGDVGHRGTTPKGGVPNWTATASANYAAGPFGVTLKERFISAGKFDTTYNDPDFSPVTYINDNSVPSRFYTDVTLRYEIESIGQGVELYTTINNLFDQDPPIMGNLSVLPSQSNGAIYDLVGRMFTFGVRAKF